MKPILFLSFATTLLGSSWWPWSNPAPKEVVVLRAPPSNGNAEGTTAKGARARTPSSSSSNSRTEKPSKDISSSSSRADSFYTEPKPSKDASSSKSRVEVSYPEKKPSKSDGSLPNRPRQESPKATLAPRIIAGTRYYPLEDKYEQRTDYLTGPDAYENADKVYEDKPRKSKPTVVSREASEKPVPREFKEEVLSQRHYPDARSASMAQPKVYETARKPSVVHVGREPTAENVPNVPMVANGQVGRGDRYLAKLKLMLDPSGLLGPLDSSHPLHISTLYAPLSAIALANASPIYKINLVLATLALNQFALAVFTNKEAMEKIAKLNPSLLVEPLGPKHPLNIALLYIPIAIVSLLIPAHPIVHVNMMLFVLAMHQVSVAIFLDNRELIEALPQMAIPMAHMLYEEFMRGEGPIYNAYIEAIKDIHAFIDKIKTTWGKGVGMVKYGINAFPYFDFATLYAPLMALPFVEAPTGAKLVAATTVYVFNMIAGGVRQDMVANPDYKFTTELRNFITSTPVKIMFWSMPLATSPKVAMGAYSVLGSLTAGNWLWKDLRGEQKSVSAVKGFLDQIVPPAIAVPCFLAFAVIYLAEVELQQPASLTSGFNWPSFDFSL